MAPVKPRALASFPPQTVCVERSKLHPMNMWYPPPILVPCFLEPYSCNAPNVSSPMMRQIKPFDHQRFFVENRIIGSLDHPWSMEDGRIFVLRTSVFELVRDSSCLELTDPKLLGWYLSLPAEDRKLIQEEGGFLYFLQRHPALEVTRSYIHLKYPVQRNQLTLPATANMSLKLNKSMHVSFYNTLQCRNCGTSYSSGAKKYCCNMPVLNLEEKVCASEEEKSLGLLPNSVKEELNLLKATRHEASGRNFDQFGCIASCLSAPLVATENPDNHAVHYSEQAFAHQQQLRSAEALYVSQLWKEGKCSDGTDVSLFKDPSAQASFSLDRELEKQSQIQKTDLGNVQSLFETSGGLPHRNQETLPEYYSLNSSGLEQCSNVTEFLEPSCSDSLLATKGSTEESTVEPLENTLASGAEICAFPDSASCNSSEWTDYTEDYQDVSNEEDSGCEPKSDEHGSLIDNGSSPVAVASQVPSSKKTISPTFAGSRNPESMSEESFLSVGEDELGVHVRPQNKFEAAPVSLGVNKAVDVSSDFRACFASNQATQIGHSTFMKLCQDAATGTDSFQVKREQESQTIWMSYSEKGMITDVRMSDLDVICEDFEYLKRIEKEHIHFTDKMARFGTCSSGAPENKGQRSVCGCDCIRRARRTELCLLALQYVMCQQHCWRCFYTSPLGESAFLGAEALPDALSQTLKTLEGDYLEMKRKILEGIHLDNLEPLSVDTCTMSTATCYSPALAFEDILRDVLNEESPSSEANPEDPGQPFQANQDEATSSESKGATSKRCRAVCVLNQQSVISKDAWLGVSKEPSCAEAWFDAQEELGSASQDCKEEKQTGQPDKESSKAITQKDDGNGSTDHCSLLCVTNLTSNVTEKDLLLWFEQYNPSQVSLTTFSSNNRAAIVGVCSPCDAEAAVKEMNGRSIQGHTVCVEHIHWYPAGCQGPIKASFGECVPASCEPAPVKEGQSTQGSKRTLHFSKPLHNGLDKLINISYKPTASGTFVPQHYATMGSFDTLMARLTERHPDVSRERIVAALLELRAKHRGYLSGLPLRDIADMTSDLLMQPSTTV